MIKLITGLGFLLIAFCLQAQTGKPLKIQMTPDQWQFPAKDVEFIQYKGIQAVKILSDTAKIVLKDLDFSSGTIEFDVESVAPPFSGIYFRRKSNEESEFFYLRVARIGSPQAMDATQYCPVVKGVTLWDMLPEYQGPANLKKGEWNHLKLVVSGLQMLVYINDMNKPALQVSRLEGNTKSGGIALNGKSVFANLVITTGETAGLPPAEGFDPTFNDARFLRNWSITAPSPMPFGKEATDDDLPSASTVWNKVAAERRGLVNLSRIFGGSNGRRIVWLKTTIHSDKEQIRRIDMGFSDEVNVLLNGQLAYTDKNWFGQPIMKQPEGRCSLENTFFMLPLKAGDNELLIGITNFFFGWGLVARLDKTDGLTF